MKFARCANVDLDPKRPFQLNLQACHIQQTGARRRVHQQIKVAALLIVSMQHRAEDARVRHAGLKN